MYKGPPRSVIGNQTDDTTFKKSKAGVGASNVLKKKGVVVGGGGIIGGTKPPPFQMSF